MVLGYQKIDTSHICTIESIAVAGGEIICFAIQFSDALQPKASFYVSEQI